MILFVNGAFGIGKTSVARALVRRLPRAVLYDPELLGMALQRVTGAGDFQDLRPWRRMTIAALRLARLGFRNVVVPMAFSNAEYLDEIRAGVARFEPHVVHVCLVAPLEVVHARLRGRGADRQKNAWEYRRAEECCAVHAGAAFATHVDAQRDVDAIADEILRIAAVAPLPHAPSA
jgi:chloramphenicol 3-O-phosphotransferase